MSLALVLSLGTVNKYGCPMCICYLFTYLLPLVNHTERRVRVEPRILTCLAVPVPGWRCTSSPSRGRTARSSTRRRPRASTWFDKETSSWGKFTTWERERERENEDGIEEKNIIGFTRDHIELKGYQSKTETTTGLFGNSQTMLCWLRLDLGVLSLLPGLGAMPILTDFQVESGKWSNT